MLPHVGVSDYCEARKACLLGYMLATLGRRDVDDRSAFGLQ
jgi:hypothetical protein